MPKRVSKLLTDLQLRRWFADRKPVAKSDGDGLTFTVSASGCATWILRYSLGGRRKELTLGRYPDLSLQEARIWASKSRLQVAEGVDVAVEKRRQKHASVATWSVRQLIDHYRTEALAHKAASTRKLWGGYIDNWLLPHLGAMAVRDVNAADLVKILKKCSERGAGAMRSLHAVASSVFEHARGQAIRDDNPAALIKRNTIKLAPPRRKGIALLEHQLRILLRSLGENTMGFAIRLHLMTGVRPTELVGAQWDEFDLEHATWSLPAARTKTRSSYTIYLPQQALLVVEKLRKQAMSEVYVFPAAYGGVERPMPYQTYRGWIRRLRQSAGSGLPVFKAHDLRRTMRSGLASLNVRFEVAERSINHKLPQMAEIYDRNDYAEARKVALAEWADWLQKLESD